MVERWSPRERIVYAAAQSVCERGVSGTALRDVVERARAPRGSLQHYFPGGKDQLITEAIAWSAHYAASTVTEYLETASEPSPSGLLAAMARGWQREFSVRGFERGCPLVAAAADVVGTDSELRASVSAGFDFWQVPIREALRAMGVPARRARALATVLLSALEGAIVLARARHDVGPLRDVVRELGPLLDSAVER